MPNAPPNDWSWVPAREWEWHEERYGTSGVHTGEGQLVWWTRPGGPSGHLFETASVQSFDEFLAADAPCTAPAHVVEEVRAFLLRREIALQA